MDTPKKNAAVFLIVSRVYFFSVSHRFVPGSDERWQNIREIFAAG
jgi:hypothetical protein